MRFSRNDLAVAIIAVLAGIAGFGLVAAIRDGSVAGGSGTTHFSSAPQQARWGQSYLPNLPVLDQDGKQYRFYDDLVRGKKVVVNFVFTSCSAICPLTMARMAQLHDKLADIAGKEVQFYSITVDPEHDGPSELKRYADAFKLSPDWRLLTGNPADIAIIRDKLGERSRSKDEHRHEMLIGNDPIGDWSKDSAYGDLDRVAINIRSMDPEWRLTGNSGAITSKSTDSGLIEVNTAPGEALFIKACASCHTIGGGDRVGPDLAAVGQRRTTEWLVQFITRPDRVLASDDPIAQSLKARFPSVVMPNLGLSDVDAADVLTYIAAKRSPSTQAVAHDPAHLTR